MVLPSAGPCRRNGVLSVYINDLFFILMCDWYSIVFCCKIFHVVSAMLPFLLLLISPNHKNVIEILVSIIKGLCTTEFVG